MTTTSPLCSVCFWQRHASHVDPMGLVGGNLCRECWERRQFAMNNCADRYEADWADRAKERAAKQ